jgi:Ni,Fe-hydrogenase III large subunit
VSERFGWLPTFLSRLRRESILVHEPEAQTLPPALVFLVDVEDWGRIARQAAAEGLRWSAAWGEDRGEAIVVTACLEKFGDYLLVRTTLDPRTPVLPSHTPAYPAADRPERHIQDMLGVAFTDHPDGRRWTRHSAWQEGEYPLRRSFPADRLPPGPASPDADYPFLRAEGSGVYEIPVGPVHAGIIEPGHFRFQAVGETVLKLEERLGYVHKGIEKRGEGRDAAGIARLAGRVSGDSTVAHAWAACMAMERAAGIEVPARALWLRAVVAERERVMNHLWDIAAVCNDVAFAFFYYQFGRLRELWCRENARAFGHRLLMDQVVPGGVAGDIDSEATGRLREQAAALPRDIDRLCAIIYDNASLQDRLVDTGVLTPELAVRLGCLGYVGRASGQPFDLRRDKPYPPYDALELPVLVYREGDVAARLRVRSEETKASCAILVRLLTNLPAGPVCAESRAPPADSEGLGAVEGWRGETLAYVRFGPEGRVARYFPRDPSWLNWPALEQLIRGNIVPDFPVCNKSVNGSYSGQDL